MWMVCVHTCVRTRTLTRVSVDLYSKLYWQVIEIVVLKLDSNEFILFKDMSILRERKTFQIPLATDEWWIHEKICCCCCFLNVYEIQIEWFTWWWLIHLCFMGHLLLHLTHLIFNMVREQETKKKKRNEMKETKIMISNHTWCIYLFRFD